MEEPSPERVRNRLANISAVLSLASFVFFFIYGALRARAMHLALTGAEGGWLTLRLVSLLRPISTLLAMGAVAVSVKAIAQKPRRPGVYALIAALFAFFLAMFVFL